MVAKAAGAGAGDSDGAAGGAGLSPDVVAALTAAVQEEVEEEAPAAPAAGQKPAAGPAEGDGALGGTSDGTLGVAEEQGVGAVDLGTVWWYLSAMGGWFWVIVQLVLLTLERVTYLSTDYFLTTWTAAERGPPDTVFGRMVGMPQSTGDGLFYGVRRATFYSLGYIVCSCANVIFAIGRTVCPRPAKHTRAAVANPASSYCN